LKLVGASGEEEKRAVEAVNSTVTYLIHCKDLCKCYNVLPSSITIIKKICETLDSNIDSRRIHIIPCNPTLI
jgi:hypothetical protein